MLLITITIADDLKGCSNVEPVPYGPCNGYYPSCVREVFTALIQNAPVTSTDYASSQIYPEGSSTGGVTGEANCEFDGSSTYVGGCQSCIVALKEWLIYNCYKDQSGYYSSQFCSLSYQQLS
ncbi:hypothetical protein LINPERPRIM_LOCUS23434 [Linum perenne]